MLGAKNKVKPRLSPIPAYLEDSTASSYLSNKIADFLDRTDHVMEEWKGLGHRDDDSSSYRMRSVGRSGSVGSNGRVGRSKSVTNIMIKGFQYYSRASSCSRPSSVARELSYDGPDCTEADEVYITITITSNVKLVIFFFCFMFYVFFYEILF